MLRRGGIAVLMVFLASLWGCAPLAPQDSREVILEPAPLDAGGGAVVVVEKVILSPSQLEVYLAYRNPGQPPVRIGFSPDLLKAHVEEYRWDFDGSVPEVNESYVLAGGEQRSFVVRYTGEPSNVDPFSVSSLKVWLPGARQMSFRDALQPGPVRPIEVEIPLRTEE